MIPTIKGTMRRILPTNTSKGASEQVITEYLESKKSSYFVKDLRNSQLLRRTWMCKYRGDRVSLNGHAIFASNLNVLNLNLFHSGLFRGSLLLIRIEN